MIRTIRDMTAGELDEFDQRIASDRRAFLRAWIEGLGAILLGVALSVLAFWCVTHAPIALVPLAVVATTSAAFGIIRLLYAIFMVWDRRASRKHGQKGGKYPTVEAFRFRIHRAWRVSTVDEDCDAILIDTGTDSWIYANGLLELCDATPDDESRIPSDWTVDRVLNGRIISSKALPPLVTLTWMPDGPEELPATITRADWTLVVLTYSELPEQWRAGIGRESASAKTR